MGADARHRYRVGIVGAGGIAHEHLPGWAAWGADVSVYALQGAEKLISDVGVGHVCADLDDLLAIVDAVDVCTPTTSHLEIVERAAAAGRHVLCEKPLGRTSEQARRMIDLCANAGVQLYPGHVVRYFPAYAAMHTAVAAGEVGEIAVQRFSRTGSRPVMAWFHDVAQSGGIVLDQMIHDIDFACWNAGPVRSVFARSRSAGDVASGVDSAQVVLTHRSGAISYVTGTWARPGTRFRTTFEIAGTGGILTHDSLEHPALQVDRGARPVDDDHAGTGLLPALGAQSPFATEIAEVGDAFTGGPPPRVDAWDGLRAVVIAEAANQSLARGQAVHLSEDNLSVLDAAESIEEVAR